MKERNCDAMPPTVAARFLVVLSSLEHVEAEEAIVSKWLAPGVFACARPEQEASEPWSGTAH